MRLKKQKKNNQNNASFFDVDVINDKVYTFLVVSIFIDFDFCSIV